MSFEPGTNSECVMEGKKSQTNIISHKNAQRTTFLAFFRSRSRERKFQGAKVPHLELSLPGANGLGSKKSSYPCETQLLVTIQDLFRRDKHVPVDMAILDFSKAFDVPHRHLLGKLSLYSINRPILC